MFRATSKEHEAVLWTFIPDADTKPEDRKPESIVIRVMIYRPLGIVGKAPAQTAALAMWTSHTHSLWDLSNRTISGWKDMVRQRWLRAAVVERRGEWGSSVTDDDSSWSLSHLLKII